MIPNWNKWIGRLEVLDMRWVGQIQVVDFQGAQVKFTLGLKLHENTKVILIYMKIDKNADFCTYCTCIKFSTCLT